MTIFNSLLQWIKWVTAKYTYLHKPNKYMACKREHLLQKVHVMKIIFYYEVLELYTVLLSKSEITLEAYTVDVNYELEHEN